MPLDPALAALFQPHLGSPLGTPAAVFGMCWPNDSVLAPQVRVVLNAGESLTEAAERLDLAWHPQWLLDAGYSVLDAGGMHLNAARLASASGAVSWDPEVRLCRVDDQVANNASPSRLRRRVAGEVALLALWTSAANAVGVGLGVRPANLDGNTRGARFKDLLVFMLASRLPDTWRVEPEVALTSIRGLHMRQNVGGRRSDIVVIDDGNRLVAVISSKWTWRSDRGTEAAQMVPLMRYRPDVPYVLATAEFPRAATVGRESIEDRAYHVCPQWVGAWLAVTRLAQGSPRETWPDLATLTVEGARVAETVALPGLSELVGDLLDSGTIL